MICVSIGKKSYKDLTLSFYQAQKVANLTEIRLDLCMLSDLERLKELIQQRESPVVLCYRSEEEGGKGSLTQRQKILEWAVSLSPEYLDLEIERDLPYLEELSKRSPQTKVILSWHGKGDLSICQEVWAKMDRFPQAIGKIVCDLESISQILQFQRFVREINRFEKRLIGIALGKKGELTRILSRVFRHPFTYASLSKEEQTAPGQVPVEELKNVYNFFETDEQTKIYGLIGDPVQYSVGNQTHNRIFQSMGESAIYVKIPVKKEELSSFLHEAAHIPFWGLSVTMPLKEHFKKEKVAFKEGLGSINTLKYSSNGWRGTNTDILGTLKLIQKKINLQGKRAVILGAGGLGRVLTHALAQEGVICTILNRTIDRAYKLAHEVDGEYGILSDLEKCKEKGYDLLVQTTSVGMSPYSDQMPVKQEDLLSNALVFEAISHPRETSLIKEARKLGCPVVQGEELFIEQALCQFSFWFGEKYNEESARKVFKEFYAM